MVAAAVAALLLLSLVTFSYPKGGGSIPATSEINQTITDKLHSIDGFFTENAGQVSNEQVRFYSSDDMQAGFAESAVLVKLVKRDHARPLYDFEDVMRGLQVQREDIPSSRGVMVRITFPGSNKVAPQGVQEMPHRSNYFIGNDPSEWRTGVRSYKEIVYRDLYDGIDLSYTTQDGQLKYEFIVESEADPALITLSYEGVEALRIDRSGELVISTALGELRDGKPITYQEGRAVECAFVQRAPLSIGFRCEGRDSSRLLVIDPLVYATFLGGDNYDWAYGIAIDSSGSAYVIGNTASTDFPTTPGSFDTIFNGTNDVSLAELNPAGSALVYATFLGGDSDDWGYAIAVDSSGNAYVTGATNSTDFPTTPGSFDATYTGGYDIFVAELNPAGSALVYATFLGGDSDDWGYAIAVDSSGNAYLTGQIGSTDFPATQGSFDTTFNGNWDAFVAKLDETGSALGYATFLGGGDYDLSYGIAVDSSGSAYVTGLTGSTDFPTTPGSFDATSNGGGFIDGFVAKLNAAGSHLVYATFLGGGSNDLGYGIAVDSSGSAYVTGSTYSTDFPAAPGSFDTTHNGVGDAFVAKLNPAGSALVYATFLGGSGNDAGIGIAIDPSGGAYVTGWTYSTDFPATSGSFDATYNGWHDAFVAKLNAAGSHLVYATFLGGNDDDDGWGIAIDSSGSAYVTGYTHSTDFPVTPGSFDTNYSGGPSYPEGFVVKLDMGGGANTPPEILSFAASPSPSFEGGTVLLAVNATDADGDALTYDFDFESDGVFDVSGPSSTATHVYGDDFNGTATVRVSDGNLSTEATTPVIVLNILPTIESGVSATATFDLTLRVAGEKWHDVTATVHLNEVEKYTAAVIRTPGSPDDQAVTIANVTLDLTSSDTWSAQVVYTPSDDPINGQMNGANPAWLIFRSEHGYESKLHHTFNVRHNDTWVWEVPDLSAMLFGMPIDFKATATDPGSDDLTFTWDWGDGSPATATTYYDNGVSPDTYPSPDGIFPFAATDVQTHVYTMAGTYTVTLRVTDDDGGVNEIMLVMIIVRRQRGN